MNRNGLALKGVIGQLYTYILQETFFAYDEWQPVGEEKMPSPAEDRDNDILSGQTDCDLPSSIY